MISQLRGVIVEHDGVATVVDCGGVGYGVKTLQDEQPGMHLGKESKLFIYEHIKEDAHDLYGFMTKSRKDLFEKLLSVNGVGPKAAAAITNLDNESKVRTAISNGDTKFISSAPGVGKKVAERVVVDLKNKLGLKASDDATAFLQEMSVDGEDEAMQALISLGFERADAGAILNKIDPSLHVNERIKLALRNR